MVRQPRSVKRPPLSIDAITAAALELIDRDGPGGLSMRKLGAALGVDPMAVYHHVDNRDRLIALTMGRVLQELPRPDSSLAWDEQVKRWAAAYRALVAAHRALAYEAMRTPATIEVAAADGTRPLVDAIAASGVRRRDAGELADLVVDYVHGHALSVTEKSNTRSPPAAFTRAIDTIVAGIRARAG
jgi:AcrR family transcriptional regulator